MSPVNGSKEGGTKIEFTGNGFTCLDIEVKLGNKDCVINMDTLTNFQVWYCAIESDATLHAVFCVM